MGVIKEDARRLDYDSSEPQISRFHTIGVEVREYWMLQLETGCTYLRHIPGLRNREVDLEDLTCRIKTTLLQNSVRLYGVPHYLFWGGI